MGLGRAAAMRCRTGGTPLVYRCNGKSSYSSPSSKSYLSTIGSRLYSYINTQCNGLKKLVTKTFSSKSKQINNAQIELSENAENLEAKRLEAQRLEAQRLEAQRLEAQRLEAQRLEAQRLEAQRLADIDYKAKQAEREESLAKWLRDIEDRETQRKEDERLKAIEVEKKRIDSNPFYLVRSTTDGEFDNWVNGFFMNLEGGKILYFVFSGDKIKELDISRDDDLNFRNVGVAGYIKTTGEKLEIISKTEHFYFLKGNQSPYKKHNHLIVATYEDKTEFYIDNDYYFGKSTWVAPDPPQNNYYGIACHG
jgi:hypothetical protein